MKKLLLKLLHGKNEKLILVGLPCLAIFVALFLFVPLITQLFPLQRRELLSYDDVMQDVTIADEDALADEIKGNTDLAPAEITPEVIPPQSDAAMTDAAQSGAGAETGADAELSAGSVSVSSGSWSTDGGITTYRQVDGSLAVGLKYIDGKIYYFDCNGRCAEAVGVDVSFYNSTIHWEAVKEAGIGFALIRIGGRGWGTGALYEDKLFFNYINRAKAAGLPVGVYFYSMASNRREAAQEAYTVLDFLQGIELDYPVYLDMEFSGDYPSGRADGLTMVERTENAREFCRIIEAAGYEAGIYANESFFSVNLNYEALSDYSIWLASYTEDNALPAMEKEYDIWQVSDRLRIAGISGTTDLNVVFAK